MFTGCQSGFGDDFLEEILQERNRLLVRTPLALAEIEQGIEVEQASGIFDVDPQRRTRLLDGLDTIGYTMQFKDDLQAFETRYREELSWLYGPGA